MEFRGASAYDQPEFFSNYMKRRNRIDSPNNAIETPIIYELISDIKEKHILDLGCGDASFGKGLLELGAKHYTGVEGSEQMVEAAHINILGENATILYETMESYKYQENSFDIVTSRFAIHYVSDINLLFQSIHNTLKANGRFVFSIQHPLTTSSFASKDSGEKRGSWIVDDYFLNGERKEPWINEIVVKYHHTIEQYFTALRKAGFTILDLREGTPNRDHCNSEEEFTRRQRIPVVLAFSCTK